MKDCYLICFFASAMAALPVAIAHAQHEGPQMSGTASAAPPNARCAEAGRKALALIDAFDMRTRADAPRPDAAARELAEVQRAVAAVHAELFTCRAAVPAESITPAPAEPMAGMDHAKITMGTPAPMAGMDHSTMKMGTPAPGAKPAAAGVKPAARGAKPADPMAGMDHSKKNMGTPATGAKPAAAPMPGMDHSKLAAPAAAPASAAPIGTGGAGKLPVMMAERIADPACPDQVGQATAPRAVFTRKVYYFCSVAARDEFRKDPAAYLKKHPR